MKGATMQRNFGVGSPLHDEDKVMQGGLLPEATVTDKADEIVYRELTSEEKKNRRIGDSKYNISGTTTKVKVNKTTGKETFVTTVTDADQYKKYQEAITSKNSDQAKENLRNENFKQRLRASGTDADRRLFAKRFPNETF